MDADFLLIQRMKNGDEWAFDAFVRKYYPAVLKYCRFHAADRGCAEDMTQETFERFFRSFDQYRHYGKAMNYLYVIAANCCKDAYRQRRELALDEIEEPTDGGMERIEERMDARRALNRLPDALRETAVLFLVQGLRQREIAQILGIGVPLVKYRIRRAKELLAEELKKEGEA